MFLSPQELAQFTGRTRSDAQQRFLAARQYPFELDADGKVLVLRATIEARLGYRGARSPEIQPDWSAL